MPKCFALSIANCSKTTVNVEQTRDIEERIQLLAETLTSPMDDQDSEEKAWGGSSAEVSPPTECDGQGYCKTQTSV